MKVKVLLALVGVLALAGSALAAVLYVPNPYPTIADALKAAKPGDTVWVTEAYTGTGESFPLVVDKNNITIHFDEGAVLKVPSSYVGIVFLGVTGGVLEGAEITSQSTTNMGDIAVLVKESAGVIIRYNEIHDVLQGIRIISSSNTQVQGNVIHDIGVDIKPGSAEERTGIGIFIQGPTLAPAPVPEVIGHGNGSTTSFSGTLAHTPVVAGSVIITAVISGAEFVVEDDGAGNLVAHIWGDDLGDIDYASGAFSLTFPLPPDPSTDVVAIYKYVTDQGAFLSGNEVYDAGEALFISEANANTVDGDNYHDNAYIGVTLNDADGNTLKNLKVVDNGTWGVRFFFADDNVLEGSEITGNELGGVELAASSRNEISGNFIHDNGIPGTRHNVQVVVTYGDKALFSAPAVFEPEEPTVFGEMRAEKEFIEYKEGLLRAFIDDLDMELEEIRQKIASAITMANGMEDPLTPSASETIAVGDGTKTEFFGRLSHVGIVRGSVKITLYVSGVERTIWDDGAENLGNLMEASWGKVGTINYSTGEWTLSLPAPPDAGSEIRASYRYKQFPEDLYERLAEKIEDAIDEKECILDVHVTILTPTTPPSYSYNLACVPVDEKLTVLYIVDGELKSETFDVTARTGTVTLPETPDPDTDVVGVYVCADDHILTRAELRGCTPGSILKDPAYNFTLPEAEGVHPLAKAEDPVTHEPLPKPYYEYVLDQAAFDGETGWDYLGIRPLDRDLDQVSFDKITIIEILKLLIWWEAQELEDKVDEAYTGGFLSKCERDHLLQKLDALIEYIHQLNENTTWGLEEIADELELIDAKLFAARYNLAVSTTYTKSYDPAVQTASFTLDCTPVIPGSVEVEVKVDTTTTLTDPDKDGYLEGTRVWGWINYWTGDVFLRAGVGNISSVTVTYDCLHRDEVDRWLEWAKEEVEEILQVKKPKVYEELDYIEAKLEEINEEIPPDASLNGALLAKKEKPGPEGITDAELNQVVAELVERLNNDPIALAILRRAKNDPDAAFSPDDILIDHRGVTPSENNRILSNLIITTITGTAFNIGIKLESPNNLVANNILSNDVTVNGEQVVGKLDRGLVMLSNSNLVAYNLFERLNIALVRGGEERRPDVQQEYYFQKLARAKIWQHPECDVSYPEIVVAVLEKESADMEVHVGPVTVTANRIYLNFFDRCGIGIDVVMAESNFIDENAFYYCHDAGIMFRTTAGVHVEVIHNDFIGGKAIVVEEGGPSRDCHENYARNSISVGLLPEHEPAADVPYCSGNFGTSDKFEELGIEEFFNPSCPTLPPMAQDCSDLRTLQVAGVTVILPADKPRTCEEFTAVPAEVCLSQEFTANCGWILVSIPVDATNPDREAVFKDDVGEPFFIWTYDPAAEQYVVPSEIEPTGGYWLYLPPSPKVLDVCGTYPTGNVPVPLGAAGWHLFSVPTADLHKENLRFRLGSDEKSFADAVAAGWIAPFIYAYNAEDCVYEEVNDTRGGMIRMWEGHWIRTYVDDLTMIIPVGSPPPVSPGSVVEPSATASDITPPPPPPLPTPDLSQIDVINEPNPVVDVHTTVFKVVGPAAAFVEAMRVRIFDLAGRLIWEAEVEGPELEWHTQDLTGAYLANGVYLYRVEVKVGGQWITTEVKKLAIYR